VMWEIHDLPDVAALQRYIIHELPQVLRSHVVTWNDHDPSGKLLRCVNTDEMTQLVDPYVEPLNEVILDHPLYERVSAGNKIVKFELVESARSYMSQHQYHDSSVYSEVYKHLEIEDQMVSQLILRKDGGVILSVNRDATFTEQDKLKLAILNANLETRLRQLQRDAAGIAEKMLGLKASLTRRELEVLQWTSQGKSNVEIATILGISKRTIDKHVQNIFEKLHVENRKQIMQEYGTLW